jgi:hypothetical protein
VGGGSRMRQLAMSEGPARTGIRSQVQRAAIQSKVFFLIQTILVHLIILIIMYVHVYKKRNNHSVQVKIKPRVRNRNMHLFSVQRSTWSRTIIFPVNLFYNNLSNSFKCFPMFSTVFISFMCITAVYRGPAVLPVMLLRTR